MKLEFRDWENEDSDRVWIRYAKHPRKGYVEFLPLQDSDNQVIWPYFSSLTGLNAIHRQLYGDIHFSLTEIEQAKQHVDAFIDKVNSLSSFL